MKKLSKNGFSIVEVLIAIVIIGLIGGAAFYVFNKQNNGSSYTQSSTEKQPPVQYTDPTKLYSLSYPKDWLINDDLPLFINGQTADKQHNMSFNFPGGAEDGAMSVMSDKTPNQARGMTEAWESTAKREPELFKTITINGYKAMHRHIESDDEEGSFVEDAYLIINKDQSSVSFLFESKSISRPKQEFLPDFDNTHKLEDFKTIINSIKFL